MKICIACGMPMNSAADFAMGDESKDYCIHCQRPDGSMHSFEEKREGLKNFIIHTQGLALDVADSAALSMMKKLPAWEAHFVFSSRCGVRCDICERKESVNCSGCVNMDAPFWGGACEVKNCCEKKGFNHCGYCGVFPCDMLSNMGKEQGFDPSVKIEQIKIWMK